MSALDQLHIFCIIPQPDGTAVLQLFRRADLHEMKAVGALILHDKQVDAGVAGDLICEALDRELATRARR